MKKTNYIVNFAIIFILTVFALWMALAGRVDEVLYFLKKLDGKDFLTILFYGIAYNLVIGMIYRVLARVHKKNYSYKEGLQVALVGSYFSGITPSATGGQFGQAYVLKKQGIKLSDGASILWIDFIVYQSVLVIYTTILMILRFNYYYSEHSSFFILVLIGYFINSGVIVFLFTMAKFPKLYEYLSKVILQFLGKIHIIKNPEGTITSWNIQLQAFTKEIKNVKHHKKMILKCVLLNIVRLTLLYSLPMYIAYVMDLDIHISMLLDIITMSAFVSTANAFFPVPGSSGGTEAAFMLIFQTMFTIEQTNSIMILWRFATYHQIILIGGITFAYLTHKYDKEKEAILLKNEYELEGKKE